MSTKGLNEIPFLTNISLTRKEALPPREGPPEGKWKKGKMVKEEKGKGKGKGKDWIGLGVDQEKEGVEFARIEQKLEQKNSKHAQPCPRPP